MSCLTSWVWLIRTLWCRDLNLVSAINSEISRKIGTFWKMRSTEKVKQYHTCVQKRCFSRSSWAEDWLLTFRISIFCNLIPKVDCSNSYSDLTVLHDGEDTLMLLWKNWRTSVGFLGALIQDVQLLSRQLYSPEVKYKFNLFLVFSSISIGMKYHITYWHKPKKS